MAWQKCPKCDGTGTCHGNDLCGAYSAPCFICNGFGVINEETGKPLYRTVIGTSSTIDVQKDDVPKDHE